MQEILWYICKNTFLKYYKNLRATSTVYQVKLPPVTALPGTHKGACEFVFWLLHFQFSSLLTQLGKQQSMVQVPGSLHKCGRPIRSSQPWPLQPLRDEPAVGRLLFLCASTSVCNSAFAVNKYQNKQTKNPTKFQGTSSSKISWSVITTKVCQSIMAHFSEQSRNNAILPERATVLTS